MHKFACGNSETKQYSKMKGCCMTIEKEKNTPSWYLQINTGNSEQYNALGMHTK